MMHSKDKVKKIAKDKLLGRGKKKKGTQPEGEEQQQEEETKTKKLNLVSAVSMEGIQKV